MDSESCSNRTGARLKTLLEQALSAYHVDPVERVLFDADRIALTRNRPWA
jgi:hypothetical protein